MKHFFIAACVVCALVFSCKKKDKDPPKPNTTTTTGGTSTGGSTSGGSTTGGIGTPTNATSFHGFLSSSEYMGAFGTFTFSANTATAYFSSAAVEMPGGSTGIEMSSVLFNGDTLVSDSAGSYAPAQFSSLDLGKEHWKVNGANGIPSFTLHNNIAKPSGFSMNALPDSISKSKGITINLGTLANIKTGTLIISDGSTSISGVIIMPLGNGTQKIQLTPSQISGMQSGQQQAIISVMLENSMGLHILGKDFKLSKQLTCIKPLSITN